MKKFKFPKRLWEPRSSTPHDCALLCFDPGKKTGYAIFVNGMLLMYGAIPVDDQASLDVVCTHAARFAHEEHVPLIVVGERWNKGGPHMTHATTASLGASWGKCEAAIKRAGVSRSHVTRVLPVMWQSMVFGGKVENTKKEARKVASFVAGRDVGGDAADAICIGLWGVCAPDVWHAIPQRHRDNAVYEAELAAMNVKRAIYKAEHAAKAAARAAKKALRAQTHNTAKTECL